MRNRSLASMALLALCTIPTLAQSAVPTDFADEVYASGISHPIALAFLPDGRLLCAEKTSGMIKVIRSDGVSASTGTVPSLNTAGFDRGLQGIAVDPQWPSRPYVYVYYTATPPARVQLSMFTMTGDLTNSASTNLVMGAQYAILSGIPDQSPDHQGGTIAFGPDGNLYVFVGEDEQECLAQNLNSLLGKVLRINVAALPQAGSGPPLVSLITPAGNPFAAPLPNGPLVWASGLRNPFRGDIDPVTGTIIIADVGAQTWEEIDVCSTPGANFGWPTYEGPVLYSNPCGPPPSNPIAPIVQHHQLSGTRGILSLAVYRNPPAPAPYAFGPGYEGDAFYTDFFDGKIRRLQPNGTSWTPAVPVPGQPSSESWALTAQSNITDAVVGPDGALYYTQLFLGSIRRIRGGASPGPTYVPTTPCEGTITVQAGMPMSFTAAAVAPPGPGGAVTLSAVGAPANAVFVPALPASGPSPRVAFNWVPTYLETGMWPILFTVTDQTGLSRTCTVNVYVTDSILAISSSLTTPTPIMPGQDFLLIDLLTAVLVPIALDQPPVFGIPNDPTLIDLHYFAQVGRYNPVLNPTDAWKLSNGVNIFINHEFFPYGQSSGLTLVALPPYTPALGGLFMLVVTQP